MPYISNSDQDIEQMLKSIGVKSVEDLLKNIPESIRLKQPLDLPDPLSECEVFDHLAELADKNITGISFVGGGAYDHYSPAIVDSLISRSEFMTAYTPYQAEVSQGTLQAIYEFQTHIARLTGMDVANASMYDGASALAEALVVAINAKGNNKVLIPEGLNPEYLEVARTYLYNYEVDFMVVKSINGRMDKTDLQNQLTDDVIAVVLQQPNYYGVIEEAAAIGELIKDHSAKFVVVTDPNSLGILEAPGNYHADIVVGEGQSLGIPLNYGGPYVGFFATRNDMIRKIPGRIVGVSEDKKGRKGYILTLQTREQHIRREKATSNICTNSGLMALATTIYLSWLGKQGLTQLSEMIVQKSHYLAEQIEKIPGFKLEFSSPFYKEFVVSTPVSAAQIIQKGFPSGFKSGIDVSNHFGHDALLVSVTEKRKKTDMDKFIEFLKSVTQN